MTTEITLAFIGGSGLYDMSDLSNREEIEVNTPFGKPSSTIMTGILSDQKVAFLARHGKGHTISPSEINYRANIYALKTLGVNRIVSISAVGSLQDQLAPGNIVIPDGLFDNTRKRINTFFNNGMVAHIGVANPFCLELSKTLAKSVQDTGATVHEGGDFITIEGPRFSTRSESNTFRKWGMSIIGMTTSPEAFLAREAEMCYAVMAHVTDYDVWHISEIPVSVEIVIRTLTQNASIAQDALRNLAHDLPSNQVLNCDCSDALADAIITQDDSIPDEAKKHLGLLIDKYL
ncbi:MAG: S-methyl-5'-thioadenosine phosphorylase [Anaerolineales bacterium]|nr:S-methyl-5'-thioadenosine phosphorylase [Anaerolineales bacterium]